MLIVVYIHLYFVLKLFKFQKFPMIFIKIFKNYQEFKLNFISKNLKRYKLQKLTYIYIYIKEDEDENIFMKYKS